MQKNEMTVRFSALSQNESFARVVAGAFASQLNPTISEVADIKTAVSEAVTNAIIHGYEGRDGIVEMRIIIDGNQITIIIMDSGAGIKDVGKAREPFYTTCPEGDRSGMGFTVMETFMDSLEVESSVDTQTGGTIVKMTKRIDVEEEHA